MKELLKLAQRYFYEKVEAINSVTWDITYTTYILNVSLQGKEKTNLTVGPWEDIQKIHDILDINQDIELKYLYEGKNE